MEQQNMLNNDHETTSEVDRLVGEFTINWNLFEKYYCQNKADISKIKELDIDDCGNIRRCMDIFRQELIDHFNRNDKDFSDEGLQDVLFTKTYSLNYAKRIRSFLEEKEYDLRDGLICIYRIRNNLLHGEKEVFYLNEQASMLRAASNVLAEMTNGQRHSNT